MTLPFHSHRIGGKKNLQKPQFVDLGVAVSCLLPEHHPHSSGVCWARIDLRKELMMGNATTQLGVNFCKTTQLCLFYKIVFIQACKFTQFLWWWVSGLAVDAAVYLPSGGGGGERHGFCRSQDHLTLLWCRVDWTDPGLGELRGDALPKDATNMTLHLHVTLQSTKERI